MTQWIDGDELLRARWSNITGLLLRAIRARTIQPFNKITLDPVTLDTDPCLFCGHPGEGAESCPHAITHLAPGQDIEALAAGRMNLLPAVCRQECAPEGLDRRVRGYAFLRSEVEAFEQAQSVGLKSTRTKGEAPVEARSQEKSAIISELTQVARSFAERAKQGVIQADLRAHLLKATSYRDHEITEFIFRAVWSSIPKNHRNRGGRPKKSS